jgi:predicted nuclease with TOPRIM domain
MVNSICEFCNKEFSSEYTLNNHKKTAKFCLKIQKENNNIQNNNESIYQCEYCNKNFSLKKILNTHYLTCKAKKEQTVDELKEQIKELKEQNLKLTIHFDNDKETIKKLEETIKKLEEENVDYKNRLIDRPSTVYNNSQQHINNYNIQYNKMFNDLIPITDEYLKSKIKELITPNSLIYVHNLDNANSNIIDYNFACSLVNILKNNVFFTDIARGKLVYKDENENKMATMAESFILDCISRSKIECLNICKVAIDTVRARENEFTDKDYGQCIMGLGQLADCIKAGKPHAIITEIANKLSKHSKNIPSVKEFKAKQITSTL